MPQATNLTRGEHATAEPKHWEALRNELASDWQEFKAPILKSCLGYDAVAKLNETVLFVSKMVEVAVANPECERSRRGCQQVILDRYRVEALGNWRPIWKLVVFRADARYRHHS
jgi:hypothetical protein